MSGTSVSLKNTSADNSAVVANFTFGAQRSGACQGQGQHHNGRQQRFSSHSPIGEFHQMFVENEQKSTLLNSNRSVYRLQPATGNHQGFQGFQRQGHSRQLSFNNMPEVVH